MDDNFFTRKEAAVFFGVSTLTMWRWQRDGRLLPASRNAGGGPVQYLVKDCIAAKQFKYRPKKKTEVHA